VASQQIIPPDAGNPYGQIEIMVQNRGTETLINTAVNVSTGAGAVTANITSLGPNDVRTIRVPISQPASSYANGMRVDAKVLLSAGMVDAKPSNNRRVETYVAAGSR
jgi:hypothetical protein